MTTISGYLKRDVLEMLKRTLTSGELETACYMSAEMVCSPGETLPLCGELVDRFCTCGVLERARDTRDLFHALRVLSESLRSVQEGINDEVWSCKGNDCTDNNKTRNKNKKKTVTSNTPSNPLPQVSRSRRSEMSFGCNSKVRENVCRMVVLTSACCRSMNDAEKKSKPAHTHRDPPLSNDGETCTTRDIENDLILSPSSAPSVDARLQKAFAPVVLQGQLLKLLRYVYEMCSRFQTTACLNALPCIVKNNIAASTSPVPRIEFPEICTVAAKQREDVAWYLWRMCLLITEGSRREFVRSALYLYQFDFRRGKRVARLPLLIAGFEVALEGLGKRREKNDSADARYYCRFSASSVPLDQAMRTALENIDVVYEDIGRQQINKLTVEEEQDNEEVESSRPNGCEVDYLRSTYEEINDSKYDQEQEAFESHEYNEHYQRILSDCGGGGEEEEQQEQVIRRHEIDPEYKMACMFFFSEIDHAKRFEIQAEIERMREDERAFSSTKVVSIQSKNLMFSSSSKIPGGVTSSPVDAVKIKTTRVE